MAAVPPWHVTLPERTSRPARRLDVGTVDDQIPRAGDARMVLVRALHASALEVHAVGGVDPGMLLARRRRRDVASVHGQELRLDAMVVPAGHGRHVAAVDAQVVHPDAAVPLLARAHDHLARKVAVALRVHGKRIVVRSRGLDHALDVTPNNQRGTVAQNQAHVSRDRQAAAQRDGLSRGHDEPLAAPLHAIDVVLDDGVIRTRLLAVIGSQVQHGIDLRRQPHVTASGRRACRLVHRHALRRRGHRGRRAEPHDQSRRKRDPRQKSSGPRSSHANHLQLGASTARAHRPRPPLQLTGRPAAPAPTNSQAV